MNDEHRFASAMFATLEGGRPARYRRASRPAANDASLTIFGVGRDAPR